MGGQSSRKFGQFGRKISPQLLDQFAHAQSVGKKCAELAEKVWLQKKDGRQKYGEKCGEILPLPRV